MKEEYAKCLQVEAERKICIVSLNFYVYFLKNMQKILENSKKRAKKKAKKKALEERRERYNNIPIQNVLRIYLLEQIRFH